MHPLDGKRIAFYGRLVNEKRRVVVAQLEMIGGKCEDRVCRGTDILVLPQNFDPSQGSKQFKDALELQKKGTLKIIDEDSFLSILRSNDN